MALNQPVFQRVEETTGTLTENGIQDVTPVDVVSNLELVSQLHLLWFKSFEASSDSAGFYFKVEAFLSPSAGH